VTFGQVLEMVVCH